MKRVLIPIICVIMILGMMSCARKDKENQVSIAYFDNITHGQALVMKHNRMLEEALDDDMEVSWVAFNAGPAEVEACFSGDIDIGYIGPVPAAIANIKSEGDFVIISGATNGGAMLIARKDADIKSAADLAGKTVAVPGLGNTQHLLLLDLMKENKLSIVSDGGNVEVIEAQNADIANLINSGDVDAALVPEPWGTTILEKTNAVIVLDYDEIKHGKDYSTAVVIVNREYLEEHGDIVEKFLKAHMETTDYIVKYKDEAAKIMNDQLGEDTGKKLDENIIKEAINRIDYTYEIPVDSILDYSGASMEQGFINQKMSKDAFEDSLLKQSKK